MYFCIILVKIEVNWMHLNIIKNHTKIWLKSLYGQFLPSVVLKYLNGMYYYFAIFQTSFWK